MASNEPSRAPRARIACAPLLLLLVCPPLAGQSPDSGRLEGRVVLETSGAPLHNVNVLIVELGRVAETDQDGGFRFEAVPAGAYDVLAFSGSLNSETHRVQVGAGETVSVQLALRISPIKQEITVTAKGTQETAFEAVQSVSSLDSFDLGK